MWKEYFSPNTLQEALQLLDKYQSRARIIAGGTDLILEIQRHVRQPEVAIDITRIEALDAITLDDNDRIHIGPAVTHNQVVGSALCRERAFPLVKACWQVGSPQIRNRATVAGNLVTASPANDTIAPLRALDAEIVLASVNGERAMSLAEFFKGVRKTALQPNEMVVDVRFPALQPNQVGTFEKLGLRKAQAISVISVATVLTFDGATVTDARITLGSAAPTIVRATDAEQFLRGKELSEAVIAEAGELAKKAAKPISDVRGSAEYRRYAVGVYTRRALQSLRDGTEKDAVPVHPVMLWGESDGHFPPRRLDENHHRADSDDAIVTIVNGEPKVVRHANDKTLLRMLREDLHLPGTKEGCAEGECGACTVFLDGIAVLSCLVPATRAHHSEIITIEGIDRHPVQEEFVAEGAAQCGYCTPGFIMSGVSLLTETPAPTTDDIKQGFAGNLCRCTGYYKIISAVEKAAKTEEEGA